VVSRFDRISPGQLGAMADYPRQPGNYNITAHVKSTTMPHFVHETAAARWAGGKKWFAFARFG